MKTAFSSKSKKSLTYSIFILLVLSVFLLGYFFYYIPKNKSTINNNGFLILKTIAGNVQEKSKGRLTYYKNISIRTNQADSSVRELLELNNIKRNISTSTQVGHDIKSLDSISGNISIAEGELIYKVKNHITNDSIFFKEELSEFFQSILAPQREELFENYALAKANGKGPQLLYHDAGFGIRTDIRLDSLLPKNVQGYLTGIRDIHSQDFDHKMFYYPFKVDTFQLVLCGFVKTDPYNSSMRKVPFGFVYPLAIAFLLLISFLPILKFYLMDSNEHIRVRDIFLFGLSVFFGAAMLTLVIIQFLLRKGEEGRVATHLTNISTDIETNFYNELGSAYDQMDSLDNVRRRDTSIQADVRKMKNVDYSKKIVNYLQSLENKNTYPFDRISWIDSSGMQVIKAEMNGQPVFTNVKDRSYFKAVQSNKAYLIPGESGEVKKIGLEPIYSWTNGDFNISLSKKSENYVVAMAAKMHSIVDVLLPIGYKFCIIDEHGDVLIHADRNRNLRENIFEKATPSDNIKKAVAARQRLDISDITMYNNNRHLMHVRPLKGLPYTLITFYDKAFISPVNLRILLFAVLFFILSASICIALWGALARGGLTKYRLLYCPMDCMTWISPQKREAAYYAHGVLFLAAYLALFLVFIGLHRSDFISNYTIFSLVLFTPANVIGVLFSIRSGLSLNTTEFEERQQKKARQRTSWIGVTHLCIGIAFFAASRNADLAIGLGFILFQLLFNLWIWLYRFSKPKAPGVFNRLTKSYKMGYSIIATFLVICLSVLPCGLYTWYAHNQEFIQSVKQQQLQLAKNLEERMTAVLNNPILSDTSVVSAKITNEMIFKNGIYTIYKDSAGMRYDSVFDWRKGAFFDSSKHFKDVSFESFYSTIADNVSNKYSNEQVYPSLQNYAADNSWRWQLNSSKLLFYYHLPGGNMVNVNTVMQIKSTMPPRFLFITGFALLWLIPFVALLVYSLYKWLRLNTDYVFLIKYIDAFKDDSTSKTKALIDEYLRQQKELRLDDQVFNREAYSKYTINTEPEDLYIYEKEVLATVESGRSFYDFIWTKFSEKEKYLLYDFALDGLINYKNTTEIYGLLGKGILIIENEKMRLFNPGFRAYLVTKADSEEIIQLHKKYHQNSSWQAIKKPLLILLLGCAVLIFFTQEAMFQKVLAVAGGLGTLISLIPKIFSGISTKPAESQ